MSGEIICRNGGTGRRTGLKIRRGLNLVRVRLPFSAQDFFKKNINYLYDNTGYFLIK